MLRTTPANSTSILAGITYLSGLVHKRYLWLLVAACAAAAGAPGFGLWLRGVSFGEVELGGEPVALSLPTLMLAYLLFSAGLGVQPAQLRQLLRDPKPLFVGLVANVAVP